jgi:PKD repeat protein
VPQAPQSAPYARIEVSAYVVTIVQSVGFDGSWSDSDGHVTKFEWDLDGDGRYEISGTPTASNRDRRSRTFTTFGDHTVRLRVTDDDGLVTVDSAEVTVMRRHPTAVLTISPEAPPSGRR